MTSLYVALFILHALLATQCRASSNPFDISATFLADDLSNSSSAMLNLGTQDDSRFSMKAMYGESDLPVTPVFMNTVELLARYAEMDYMGRTRQRHGIVLPEYPQVEIAVLPAAPSTSVEVRFVVWGMYDGICDMVEKHMFKENEIALRWNGKLVAHIYFTKPLDTTSGISNQTHDLTPSMVGNTTLLLQSFNGTNSPDNANTGRFEWLAIFKPNAKTILPKDVFLVVLGVLRSVAENSMTEKVPGAFRIGSPAVNANMQFYLQDRRSPRTRPPFFQYAHVLEAVRRTPTWMLQERRFAESYFALMVNTIGVGQAVLDRGPFSPRPTGTNGNVPIV